MPRLLTKKIVLRAPLTNDHVRFVDEYILDFDPEAAAKRARINPSLGPTLLGKKAIQAAIQTLTLNRGRRTEIYADEVLRRWWMLVTADVRELIQVHWVNCRFCWGNNHRYQFRDHELMELELRFNEENDKLPREKQRAFNDQGGGGFDGERDPHRGPLAVERMIAAGFSNVPEPNSDHNCPGCDGRGEKSIWLNDSRYYSPGAALLYQGVKVSKDGSVELKFRDQEHAEDMVAQHLGMLVQRSVNLDLDPTKLSDEQLDTFLGKLNRFLPSGEDGPVIEHSSGGEIAPPER